MDNENPETAPNAEAIETAASPSRTWRATLAGAVAGGVLAASAAVPITWAALRSDAPTTTTPAAAGIAGASDYAPPQAPSTVPWGGAGNGAAAGATTDSATDSATATAATAAQSQGVVLIDTTLPDGEAAGTGLLIDPSGLVLTNYHVVEGSTSITVTLADEGTAYDATVVGTDATADVALLQLDDASGLEVVDLDDDGDPAVADTVTAIGNAEGQGSLSASTGSVVALDQSITTASSATAAGEDLSGLIQTDAYVVGGYSGGALLDQDGEVVGITTAASQGGPTESYAVPIATALDVAEQIVAGDESAEVQVGPAAYLGVGVTEAGSGLVVGQVEAGSAADAAGVEVGSQLTSLDGARVATLDALRAVLATLQPGDRAVLRWVDGSGTTRRASVRLGESPIA